MMVDGDGDDENFAKFLDQVVFYERNRLLDVEKRESSFYKSQYCEFGLFESLKTFDVSRVASTCTP